MAKVMIADDMKTVLHNMSFVLENYEHTVVAKASNCAEALVEYRKNKPDILLLDILGMDAYSEEAGKQIDSFELIKIIIEENPNANIIVLTASPREDYIKRALVLGAKGFLVKGVSNEKLVLTINNILTKGKQ